MKIIVLKCCQKWGCGLYTFLFIYNWKDTVFILSEVEEIIKITKIIVVTSILEITCTLMSIFLFP